jgi:hypothetical protein
MRKAAFRPASQEVGHHRGGVVFLPTVRGGVGAEEAFAVSEGPVVVSRLEPVEEVVERPVGEVVAQLGRRVFGEGPGQVQGLGRVPVVPEAAEPGGHRQKRIGVAEHLPGGLLDPFPGVRVGRLAG